MPSEMLCLNCTLDNGQRTKEVFMNVIHHCQNPIELNNFNSTCKIWNCMSTSNLFSICASTVRYRYDGHWLYGNFETQSTLAVFSAGSPHCVWAHNFDNGYYNLDV